jgi:hypothetical protein
VSLQDIRRSVQRLADAAPTESCPECGRRMPNPNGRKSSKGRRKRSTGVTEILVHREGEPEPEVAGHCSRCGYEPRVLIILERIVAARGLESTPVPLTIEDTRPSGPAAPLA